jgi:hypothetical protein
MLPWQQPEQLQEERMPTREKIEWGLIILGILALWPLVFAPEHPISGNIIYKVVVFGGLPLALIFVFVSRLRRFNKALHEQDPLKDDDRYES